MQANGNKPSLGRTLLILGRVSNLPTVWSNCLAGWLLAGPAEWRQFGWLCAGASLLYVGGMYLNDACDSRFDAAHRVERPIPSGAIATGAVWVLSLLLLGAGFACLAPLGREPALAAGGLVACIVIYDLVHKKTAFAPVLMAGCRFLLYLVAAAAARDGVSRAVLWSALALAAYVVGLSWVARKESTGGRVNIWPALFLFAPPLIAAFHHGWGAWAYSVPLLLWVSWCLRTLVRGEPGATGRAVSGLLAGIVWVDFLAVQGGMGGMPLLFLLLFGSALLLQRIIPAT